MQNKTDWKLILAIVAILGGMIVSYTDLNVKIASLQVEMSRNKEMIVLERTEVRSRLDRVDGSLLRIEDKIDDFVSKN